MIICRPDMNALCGPTAYTTGPTAIANSSKSKPCHPARHAIIWDVLVLLALPPFLRIYFPRSGIGLSSSAMIYLGLSQDVSCCKHIAAHELVSHLALTRISHTGKCSKQHPIVKRGVLIPICSTAPHTLDPSPTNF